MFATRDVPFETILAVAAVQLFAVAIALICWKFAVQRQPDQTPTTKPSPQSSTFRLSGIPKDFGSKEEIQAWLQCLPGFAGSQNTASSSKEPACRENSNSLDIKISIASENLRYSQAIVTVTSTSSIAIPARIKGPPGHEIEIDDHFQGLTVLYADDTADAGDGIAADIIFVHGLGGHAIHSWRSRTSSEFWIVDFLPQDVKHARIMTYGYDTTLDIGGKQHHGKKSINSLAKSMLEEICTMRYDEATQKRPIIFMGHSLGGLVIKEALVTASKSKGHKPWQRIFQSCQSLVFFGVPNLGMSFEELARMVDGSESEQLVRDLLVDNDHDTRPLLQRLNEEFVECLQHRNDLDILCYYETKLSPRISKEKDQGISHRGTLIVNQASAAYTGLTARSYNILELEGDHRSMVKFAERNRTGYRGLSRRIKQFIDRAIETGRSDFIDFSTKLTTEDQACIQSLAYTEMGYRRQEADGAHPNTCNWILEHENHKRWRYENRGLLWIKGKPGSGKSTLMAFLYGHLQKVPPVERGLSLDYFFHRRGVELQKSINGMLRSFLCQLYIKVPSVRKVIFRPFQEKRLFGEAGAAWQWQPKELRDLFIEAVVVAATSMKMTIFVDALDEAGEEGARDLASFFHHLNDRLDQAQGTAKICISCRHYPIVATIPGLEIWVENYNSYDIALYVRDTLYVMVPREFDSTSTAIKDLESDIVEKSSGVFQWARLVLPIVAEQINDGDSIEEVHALLARVPQGLSEIYEYILKSVIKRRNYDKTLRLMRWVCLAERPLSLTELRYAMVAIDASIHSTARSFEKVVGFADSDERMARQTISLSGGLAEVKYQDNGSTVVQFVHQSVNDYLRSSGLAFLVSLCQDKASVDNSVTMSEDFTDDIIGGSQHWLTQSCVTYVLSAETSLPGRIYIQDRHIVSEKEREVLSGIQEKLPFIVYATGYWLVHAEKAESHGFFQTHLIEAFGSPPGPAFQAWIEFHKFLKHIERWQISSHETGSTLLHAGCSSNLSSVVEALLNRGTDPNQKDDAGNRPLHLAARKGVDKLAQMLIERGAEIRAKNNSHNTALELAAANGAVEIVNRLLNLGVDVNESTGDSGNALYGAAIKGSEPLVRILLRNGADVNAQGGLYGNALQAASLNGHEGTVKLLLDMQADINAQGGLYGNALQVASFNGHEGTVKLLLDMQADINAPGGHFGNALQVASFNGHEGIVKLLLDMQADVNAPGGHFGNALQAASLKGHEGIVKLLLDMQADVNAQGGYCGNALQAASSGGHEETVKLLLDMQADVNAQGGIYGNALQAASFNGHKETVKLLLNRGANMAGSDMQGRNALYLAMRGNSEAIFQILISLKALREWATPDVQGCSSLHFAASGGSTEALASLLDTGCDVNELDTYGWTALHWASRNGSHSACQMLLTAGCDVSKKDSSNRTAFDVAVMCQHGSLLSLLYPQISSEEASNILSTFGRKRHYPQCSCCFNVSTIP
ncbi:hypothetical protein BP5796_03463 [Coleophoma crateriformis]|uniref:Uncharacterized protein n=1 Tax=Coleophoma crateriformis TaxID=565419 RepID=A0A3D8SN56_9HELO|nr:hypothetical protein BP5796_03463 [Coleophoma crateriformis]